MTTSILRFGPFTLDSARRLLCEHGVPARLGPKVVETLAALADRPGELVTKAELLELLWPNQFVAEGNLTQNVYRLRRILAAGGLDGAIETLACRGYRFTAPVERLPAPADALERLHAPADVVSPPINVVGSPQSQSQSPERQPVRGRFAVACVAAVCLLAVLAAGVSRPRPATAFARLSPESQRLYRVGRYHWNLRADLAHVRESARDFEAVVKRDPRNPLGYSGLADAQIALFDILCDSAVTGCERVVALAETNARRAVALDPDSAEAHTSLAMTIHAFGRGEARSDAEFERAIQLDPAYAPAHHWYGNALLVRGRTAQAAVQHRAALALEPDSPSTYAWLAHDAFFSRRYDEAVAYAREALAISPNRHPTRVLLGLAYERLGNERAAMASFDRLPSAERDALVAALYARTGRRARALARLGAAGQRPDAASGATLAIAFAWAALGDRERAYAFLRAARLANDIERRFLALDPRLDALRADPRFRPWTVLDEAVARR
jgi:DNA-binding winged helix-turn-helix (wHTH) protein/tetratricopeptide (TPR) repeat protein